jgi:hypothetical protein
MVYEMFSKLRILLATEKENEELSYFLKETDLHSSSMYNLSTGIR